MLTCPRHWAHIYSGVFHRALLTFFRTNEPKVQIIITHFLTQILLLIQTAYCKTLFPITVLIKFTFTK